MEIMALWHSSETAVLGFWGLWLIIGALVGGGALVALAAYGVKEVKKK